MWKKVSFKWKTYLSWYSSNYEMTTGGGEQMEWSYCPKSNIEKKLRLIIFVMKLSALVIYLPNLQ